MPHVVAEFVRSGEEHQGHRDKSEKMFTPVNSTPPTKTQGSEKKREPNHADLETFAREEAKAQEREDRETQREGKTVHRTRKRDDSPDSIHVV
jgi:hypothetical protein